MTQTTPQPLEVAKPQAELAFLHRRLSALARGRYRDELEDLATEAWIRLDRFRQHSEARNPDALMNRIAQFVWIDFIRRQMRAGQPTPSLDEGEAQSVATSDPGVDPQALALFRFATLEYFSSGAPQCHELARHYFSGLNWFQVAERLGEKRNAIAKRWQRCVERLSAMGRKDPGGLGAILRELESWKS